MRNRRGNENFVLLLSSFFGRRCMYSKHMYNTLESRSGCYPPFQNFTQPYLPPLFNSFFFFVTPSCLLLAPFILSVQCMEMHSNMFELVAELSLVSIMHSYLSGKTPSLTCKPRRIRLEYWQSLIFDRHKKRSHSLNYISCSPQCWVLGLGWGEGGHQ